MPSYRDVASSFLAGELDPATISQVDDATRANGASRIRNMYVRSAGGVKTRPGMRLMGVVSDTYLNYESHRAGTVGLEGAFAQYVFTQLWQTLPGQGSPNGFAVSRDQPNDVRHQALRFWFDTEARVRRRQFNEQPPGLVIEATLRAPSPTIAGARVTTLEWIDGIADDSLPDRVRWEAGTGKNATFTLDLAADPSVPNVVRYQPIRQVRALALGWRTQPRGILFPDQFLIDSWRYGREGLGFEEGTPLRLVSMPLATGAILGLFLGDSLKTWTVLHPDLGGPGAGFQDPRDQVTGSTTGWVGAPVSPQQGNYEAPTNSILFPTGFDSDDIAFLSTTTGRDFIEPRYEEVTNDFTKDVTIRGVGANTKTKRINLVIGYKHAGTRRLPGRLYCANGRDFPLHVLRFEFDRNGDPYLAFGREAEPVPTEPGFNVDVGDGYGFANLAANWRRSPTALNVDSRYGEAAGPTYYVSGTQQTRTGSFILNDQFRFPAWVYAQTPGFYDLQVAFVSLAGFSNFLESLFPADLWAQWALSSTEIEHIWDNVQLRAERHLAAGKVVSARVQMPDGNGPFCVLWHQGRMLMAGSAQFPSGWWGTEYSTVAGWGPRHLDAGPHLPEPPPVLPGNDLVLGASAVIDVPDDRLDPTPVPSLATDPFFIESAGARANAIDAMYPSRRLVFFGLDGVFFLESESIDANAIGFRWSTDRGIKRGVPPVGIGANRIAYAARDNRSIWLMTYAEGRQDFLLSEMSAASPHLINDPTDMIYTERFKDGSTAVLVRNTDGSIACCAIEPEAEWHAWSLWNTAAVGGSALIHDMQEAAGHVYAVTSRPVSAERQVFIEVFDEAVELDFCQRTRDGTHDYFENVVRWDVVAEMGDRKIRIYNVWRRGEDNVIGRHTAEAGAGPTIGDNATALTDVFKAWVASQFNETETDDYQSSDVDWWQIGRRFEWTIETMPFVRRTGSGNTFTRRSITKEAFVDWQVEGETVDENYTAIGGQGAMRVNGNPEPNTPQLFTEAATKTLTSRTRTGRSRFLNLAGWRNEDTLTLQGNTPLTISSISRKTFA